MSVYEVIMQFYKKLANDEYHRYKSWEHCYSYFQSSNQIDEEYASLHLAFYLASWGMYRGSSYLLWKDYKVHKELVLLLKSRNMVTLDLTYDSEIDDEKNIEVILSLFKEVKNYYPNKISAVNGVPKEIKTSDTLASKILLGVNACMPAFDRFFCAGLKQNKITTVVNEETLTAIFKFYRDNIKDFKAAQQRIKEQSGIDYPPMKLADMYFWEVGRKKASLDLQNQE